MTALPTLTDWMQLRPAGGASVIDLFSRQSRPGWAPFGNEAGLFDKEIEQCDP